MSQPSLHKHQSSTGIKQVRCHCMLQNILKRGPVTNALILQVGIAKAPVCNLPLVKQAFRREQQDDPHAKRCGPRH